MKRLFMTLALMGMVAAGTVVSLNASASAATNTVDQKRSFGTIARGSTVCVGPLSPSTADGVQLFGFTNANTVLTWQVFSVSSQNADALVFQTTARTVSQVIPPSGNLMFHACVVKSAGAAQDYDITLNSQPVG
jgi:hypothetical protein